MDATMPAIDTFIDGLINQKFADRPLDDAAKADVRKELTERLNQYMTLRTIEFISTANPDAVTQLSELIKTDPAPDKVNEFIAQYVREPDVLIAQIFTDFQNLYLGIQPPKTN